MSDIVTQLTPVFEKVAEKIGEGAQWGWPILIRQQYIEGVIEIIGGIVGIALAIGTLLFIRYCAKKYKEDRYSMWDFGTVIIGILGSIVSIIFILFLPDGIAKLLNPSYYALQALLQAIPK